MSAQALVRDLERDGVTLSLVADGQIAVDGPRAALDRYLPEIRLAKPELLALLSQPANAPEPHRLWLVSPPEPEPVSVSCTPPATLAYLQERYPGALVEPEPEPEPLPGAVLHPDELAVAHALLRHWGEMDTAIGQEWLHGLARDLEKLRQARVEAARLGITPDAPAPEPEPEAPPGATCSHCRNFRPNALNPLNGFGRCRADAPASRRPPTLWPNTIHNCPDWRPLEDAA